MNPRLAWRSLLLLISLAGVSCTPRPAPPPPPPPAATSYSEEALPAPENARVEIIDLQEIPEPETQRVRIAGTLINYGKRSTNQVSVKVRAVDEHNNVVASIYGVPSTQQIPAGGSATFAAWFDDMPQVRRYHVEALVK
jgi:hypothetical protein